MAVGVVGAHRDECHARAARGKELRVGIPAAVVRDLQDVRAQIDPVVHEPRLRPGAEVSGEQDSQTAHVHPDDHRQVVRFGRRGRPLGSRCQHFHGDPTDRPSVSGDEDRALPTRPPHEPVEGTRTVVRGRQGAGGDDSDLAAPEGAGQPSDVVGVEVRDQHEGQRVDPEPVEAPVHCTDVRPRVDEHPGAVPRGQHDRVPLTDVARDGHGVRGRPAPDQLACRPAEDEQSEDRGQRQWAQPTEAPHRPAEAEQEDGQEYRSGGPRRPAGGTVGDLGGPLRDDHEPARRPAPDPHQGVGDEGQRNTHEGGEEPQDGRCRDRRSREQVGGQGDEADGPGQAGDDGRGHDPGGGAHGDRVGEHGPAPPLPQAPRPARGEQHDARGRRDGQGEAGIPGQPRVEQEQHAHRPAQRRNGGSRPPGGERQQGDGAHHGRAEHARARSRQDDEPDQGDGRHHGLPPPVHRPPAQRHEHARQDDGDVRT